MKSHDEWGTEANKLIDEIYDLKQQLLIAQRDARAHQAALNECAKFSAEMVAKLEEYQWMERDYPEVNNAMRKARQHREAMKQNP